MKSKRPALVTATNTTNEVVRQAVEVANPEMPHVIPPRGLRIQQAAAYSGLTVWRIRSLIWDRAIPYIEEGKRQIILKDDLDKYLDRQRKKAVA